MTVLVSLGGSVSTIHSNTKRDLFNRAVAAIHSFRGHMEQIIFDSSQLLRPATFWKNIRVVLFLTTLITAITSLEVMYLFLQWIAVINYLKYTVPFPFVLSLAAIRCHSLSFAVIRCHLLSLVVPLIVTHCHSLSLVVTRCTTLLSFYKRSK